MANSIASMSVMVVGDKTYQIVDENAVTDVQVNGSSIVSSGVANTNIKTINNQSLLGSGDLTVGGSQQVWYGTCGTGGSTATKVVTTTTGDFDFKAGNVLYVRFTNANTATGDLSVTVDGTNKALYFGNGRTAPKYWSALETLALVYNGTSFYAVNQGIATTLHYGATMLENSVTSTRTDMSATPNSVRQAYEKAQNAMDAIPEIQGGLTNSINVNANSYTDVTIVFDTEFSAVPNVVVSIYSTSTAGAIGSLTASALDVTTKNFKVRVFNAGSASRSPAVNWIAIN